MPVNINDKEIEIVCDKCSTQLVANFYFDGEVRVEPCQTCLAEEYGTGVDDGKLIPYIGD